MSWSRSIAVTVVVAIAAAGCGSSGKSSSSASASGGTSSGGASSNGEAAKPPAQILTDAAAALRSAHGYILSGDMIQNGQRLRVRLVAPGSNSLEMSISSGAQTADMLVLPSTVYMRANAAFWSTHLGPHGAALANRWVQVPPSTAETLGSELSRFAPATLARCLTENHGTLTLAGRAIVGGQPAIVIKDAGNVPGDGPGTLAVASSGPPYPLQARSTGPTRPGGRIDACNDGKGGDGRAAFTFSHYNRVPALRPPPRPIPLGRTTAAA